MSMIAKVAPASGSRLVPLHAAAEPILGHLEQRRSGLARYSINALRVTALALAAAHGIAYRFISSLAGDSSARMANYRLSGQRAMAVEDVAALIEEGPLGVEVAMAILRVLIARAGGRIVMDPLPVQRPTTALAAMLAQNGALSAQATLALEDGSVDPHEYATLAPAIEQMRRCVEAFDAACAGVAGAAAREAGRAH